MHSGNAALKARHVRSRTPRRSRSPSEERRRRKCAQLLCKHQFRMFVLQACCCSIRRTCQNFPGRGAKGIVPLIPIGYEVSSQQKQAESKHDLVVTDDMEYAIRSWVWSSYQPFVSTAKQPSWPPWGCLCTSTPRKANRWKVQTTTALR